MGKYGIDCFTSQLKLYYYKWLIKTAAVAPVITARRKKTYSKNL